MSNNQPVKRGEIPSQIEKLCFALGRDQELRNKALEGRTLTLIEASIPDKEQREAVKSLFSQILWDIQFKSWEIVNQWAKICNRDGIEPSQAYLDEEKNHPIQNWFD